MGNDTDFRFVVFDMIDPNNEYFLVICKFD
jgi:hypothetical protein